MRGPLAAVAAAAATAALAALLAGCGMRQFRQSFTKPPSLPEERRKEFPPFKPALAYDALALRLDLCQRPDAHWRSREELLPSNYWPSGRGSWAKPLPTRPAGGFVSRPSPWSFIGIALGNGLFIDYNRNISLNVLSWLGLEGRDPLAVRAERTQALVPAPVYFTPNGAMIAYPRPGEPGEYINPKRWAGTMSYSMSGGRAVFKAEFADRRLGRFEHSVEAVPGGAMVRRGGETITISAGPEEISASAAPREAGAAEDKTGARGGRGERISLSGNRALIRTPGRDFAVALDTAAGSVLVEAAGGATAVDSYEITREGGALIVSMRTSKGVKVPVARVLQDERNLFVEFAGGDNRRYVATRGEGSFTVLVEAGSKSYSTTYVVE